MSKNGGGKGNGGNAVPQKVRDQNGDQVNRNKGTPGTNKHYDKAQGNRGKQIALNQKAVKS